LTRETAHKISEKEFSLMKRTAFLVNTSRGGVVDEQALYKALVEGKIAKAALDVFEKEPISLDNPLLGLKNVILTPHIAGITQDTSTKQMTEGAKAILQAIQGKMPRNVNIVNPEVLDRFR
jgi:phosphoglycerate dehydrogenase-like enzyme